MEFLHYKLSAGPEDQIEVRLDAAANVRLLDESSYGRFRRGERHEYLGGYVKVSPYFLKPPRNGRWHVVVDLGGGAGSVRASVRLLPQSATAGARLG